MVVMKIKPYEAKAHPLRGHKNKPIERYMLGFFISPRSLCVHIIIAPK